MGRREELVKIEPGLAERDEQLDRKILSALEVSGLNLGASAFVCDLGAMRYGQWRARENVYPASVIKVAIMAEVFHRYERGSLRADSPVTIDARNQTTSAGPAPFVPGYCTTVGELVEFMIVFSDNVATNQLMDLLGRQSVTAYMHALGLEEFLLGRKLSGCEPLVEDPDMLGRNRLPAFELGRLLQLLACDALPHSAEQRRLLRLCDDGKKLVPGLRPTDVFMHKTGETSAVSHDAGILVTADGARYVVVLYCEVEPKPDGSDASWINPAMTAWMRALREDL